jgi:hypothetical protein
MPRKPGLTKEAHFALGLDLAQAQDAINAAILKVGGAYLSNGREVKPLERVARALEKARSVMDDAICRELPPTDHSATKANYPPSAGRSGACHWSG